MKILRQLFRQPIKTSIGVVLITLAVAILCVSVGQAFAVRMTEKRLNDRFSTVALPYVLSIPEEQLAWLEKTAAEHPDIVKSIAKHGFLSAYIPELTAMNYTSGKHITDRIADENAGNYFIQPEPYGRPYSCAMLVITLEEVCEPKEKQTVYIADEMLHEEDFPAWIDYQNWRQNAIEKTLTYGYTRELSGTITQVVSLQEGFRDPTGMIARLKVSAPTLEELESFELQPGEKYIVYGMDYYDEDWALRGYLADERGSHFTVEIDAFDMSKLHILTENEKEVYKEKTPWAVPFARYDGTIFLLESEYKQVNAVSMSLALPINDLDYNIIRENGNGKVVDIQFNSEYSYKDENGNDIICTAGEYTERYKIPTIARLEGSVEDFLNSAEGTEWKAAFERNSVNNSSFAVLGVDKLGYLADFVRGNSRVTAGSDFTDEVLKNSNRVCIMHEALAAANGLQIGDSISLNYYRTDSDLPYQKSVRGSGDFLNPSASFFFDTTPIAEAAEYTIVGFWRGEMLWPDVAQNPYAFSPNTIFVPNNSSETEMEHRTGMLFTTTVIHNGKLEEFRELAEEAGYDEKFAYYDQGYSAIMKNFFNYEDMAVWGLLIGTTIYAVIMLLFLLLYPGSHFKAVKTMESLGVPFGKRCINVLMSSMSIVTASSVLGGILGALLWRSTVNALQTSAEAATALIVEPGTMIAIVAAQLVVAFILNALVSLYVAAPKRI